MKIIQIIGWYETSSNCHVITTYIYQYKNQFDWFDTVSILFTICCVLSTIGTKFGMKGLRIEKKRSKWYLLLWKLSYHGNGELLITCQF